MLSMADSKTLPNRLDVLQPSMQVQRKASSLSVPWVSRTMSCACLNLTKTNPRFYPRHSVIRTRFGISARVLPMKHYSLPAIVQVSNNIYPYALTVGADMIYVVGGDPANKKASLWKQQHGNEALEEQFTLDHAGISR